MNLHITGHHLDVTPAIRSYVEQRLEKVDRHFDQLVDVKVLLSVDENKTEKGKRQCAECTIRVKGQDLFAKSTHEDLYAAIDSLMDKMDRQVRRHKEKLRDHQAESVKRMVA